MDHFFGTQSELDRNRRNGYCIVYIIYKTKDCFWKLIPRFINVQDKIVSLCISAYDLIVYESLLRLWKANSSAATEVTQIPNSFVSEWQLCFHNFV